MVDKRVLLRDRLLFDAALGAALTHGLTIRVAEYQPKPGCAPFDALVRVEHGGNEVLYAAEVCRALRPGTLGVALHALERLGQRALLVADYVTPELADQLKARRVAFIDAAGNAYLEQPRLLIWVKGQKPAARQPKPPIGRAFQPTGLQLLFALLCNPQAVNRSYRELAAMSGVAHGTVGWVMPDLKRLGFLRDLEGKRGTRQLLDTERLLRQWADAYARVLRPRLLLGRYYAPAVEGWRDWPLEQHGALWGGEPAGAVLTGNLRPRELTIYAEKMPALLAKKEKFLNEPAPGHTAVIEVRKRFWNFPGEGAPPPEVTPPLLVYADLLATGDGQCIDAAKRVYDGHMARLLARRGDQAIDDGQRLAACLRRAGHRPPTGRNA